MPIYDVFQKGLIRGAEHLPYDPEKAYAYVEHPVEGWRVYLRNAVFLQEAGAPADHFLVFRNSKKGGAKGTWEPPKGQMEGKDLLRRPSEPLVGLLVNALMREVEEEVGLKVSFDELYYLGIVKECIDSPGRFVRHLCHTYFHETKLPLSVYKLQESEVDGIFEVNIADGVKLFSGETAAIEAVGLVGGRPVTRQVSIADMASAEDRCGVTKYYLKVFILADQFLKGQRPLAI